jgi:hypothetical protein
LQSIRADFGRKLIGDNDYFSSVRLLILLLNYSITCQRKSITSALDKKEKQDYFSFSLSYQRYSRRNGNEPQLAGNSFSQAKKF